MAGIADMLIGGYNSGRALAKDRQAEANKSRLGQLLGNAYATGDYKAALPEMARIDHGAAMDAQQQFKGIEESERAEFAQTAQIFVGAMTPEQRAQAWPAIRQRLSQRIPEAQYPEQWNESLLPQAQQLAQMIGGQSQNTPAGYQQFELMARAGGLEGDDRQRAARIALGMDPRASSAAIQYKEVQGADGRTRIVAMDPREVGAQVVGGGEQYGSGVQAPQGGDPFADLLASVPGLRVTSRGRAPEENARLPNSVPNSYHIPTPENPNGRAIDIGRPDPQQRQAISQWASQNGFEVVDNYQDGHVHLEPAPNRGQQHGANPFVGRRPEDEAAAKRLAEGSADLQLAPAQAQAKAAETRAVEEAKAGVKRDADAPKRVAKYEQALSTAQNVGVSIDKALGMADDFGTTGFVGARLRGFEGSGAFDLSAEIETIKANLGFDRLQQMRDNSPTGGALGQVAIQELIALQSTVANLNPDQSAPQLKDNLERIRGHYSRWRAAVEQALASEGGKQEAGPASNDIDGLLGKYGIR